MFKKTFNKLILFLMLLLGVLLPVFNAHGARTDGYWNLRDGNYLEPTDPLGYDILISGIDKYLNFGFDSGTSGYGFRDSSGTMQFKNSGGAWTSFSSLALSDGDKGDITVSGSGTTWTIDNLAVTNAKINDVAWSKITGTPTTLSGYGITDAIDGSGTATYIPFFSDSNTLTTDSHFTYDSVNDVFHTHKIAGDATDGLIIESSGGTDIGILGAANTANVTWYGNHNFDTVTASRVAQFGASKTLESSTVTTTELGYLSGVTSAIQTQINAKFTLPALTSGSVLFSDGSTITQDNSNFFWDDTNNYLRLGAALSGPTINSATTNLTITKSNNGFITVLDGQNRSNGASASTDIVLYNDSGTDLANYVDFGINSTGYTGSSVLNGAGDAYLYNVSEDLVIGTATAGKNVVIFTGGTGGTALSKTRVTFTDTSAQFMDGTAAAPSIAFAGSTTTGFYESSAGVLGVSIAGVNRGLWSATSFSTNSSNGGTMAVGDTAQFMDFGGTQIPSSNTFQTVRTSLTWTPDVNRTNAFAFNNQLVLGGSTTGLTITTLVGNRSAILTAAASTIGFTFTDAIAFEARQFVNNSSGTVTGTNEIGFLANNMTNTVSTNKRGFVGEMSSGSNKYNLYMSGTAENYLAGNLAVGITTASAKLHVVQTGTTTPVQWLSSTATNDDPTKITLQSRTATTNATVTSLGTIASATGYSYLIETKVIGRRTGGAGGAAGDYATYTITASANNEGGVLNIDAVTTTVVWEDQAGWDATIDASGTDIRIRVTGAASNNITWHATTMYYLLST